MIIAGMDTDASGAVVMIDTETNDVITYRFSNTKHPGNNRKVIDLKKAYEDLESYFGKVDALLLENQVGRPMRSKEGKAIHGSGSTFNFGATFGHCEAIANLLSNTLTYENASTWKPRMQVSKAYANTAKEQKNIKLIAKRVADTIAGDSKVKETWKLVKHTSICESFLLAINCSLRVSPIDFKKPFNLIRSNT